MTTYLYSTGVAVGATTTRIATDHAPNFGYDVEAGDRPVVTAKLRAKRYNYALSVGAEDLKRLLVAWVEHGLAHGMLGPDDVAAAVALVPTTATEHIVNLILARLPDSMVQRIVENVLKRVDV